MNFLELGMAGSLLGMIGLLVALVIIGMRDSKWVAVLGVIPAIALLAWIETFFR